MRYEWGYARDDYVEGLTTWASGRFVREMLGDDEWKRFMDQSSRRPCWRLMYAAMTKATTTASTATSRA